MNTTLNSKILQFLFALFQLSIIFILFEINCRQAVNLVAQTNGEVHQNNVLEQTNDADSIDSLQTQNEREFQEQICTLSPGREEEVENIANDNENQAINELYSIEL